MTTFTDDELAALRAVAEAATPVEWRKISDLDFEDDGLIWHVAWTGTDNDGINHAVTCTVVNHEETSSEADAAHIAAFDPPTALRLLDELAAARARIRELEALLTAEQAAAEADGDEIQAAPLPGYPLPPARGFGRGRAGTG